jgi:acetyl esterase/lipase
MSDRTVVWGHSQGGGAALWVGVEQATYAPDVPLAGVAALAPASDMISLSATFTSGGIGAVFGAYALKGYSEVYPDVKFDDYVNAEARAVLEEAVERCLSERTTLVSVVAAMTGEPLFSTSPQEGPLAQRLAENIPSMVTGISTFIGQGATDDTVLPDVQAAFVQTLCDAGQDVSFYLVAGRDHMGVVAEDSPLIPELLTWTDARFAGEPVTTGCTTTDV